jgi:hypothetical protein
VSTTTDVRERLDQLIGHIRSGRIMEAMTEFYDESAIMGEPAYGQDVQVEQVAVAKWKDGKIVHERFYYNMG